MNLFENLYNEAVSDLLNETNKYQDIDQRIQSGRVVEDAIKKLLTPILQKKNYSIRDATREEDMYKKVDFFVKPPNSNVEEGVQIKYRDRGEDILLEIMKPFDESSDEIEFSGRDMRGISKHYAVLAPNRRTVYWCDADLLKEVAQELTKRFLNKRKTQNIMSYTHPNVGELKITRDPNSNQTKLMGFFNPRIFAKETFHAQNRI